MIDDCTPEEVSMACDVPVPDRSQCIELESLVRAMADGNTSALTELYDATVGKIVAITRAILRNAEDAEEVTCDVYTRAWQTAHKFDRARGSVIGWLQLMARSRAIDVIRQRKIQLGSLEPTASVSGESPEERLHGSPEDCLALFQSGIAVHAALAGLSAQRRELVQLAFFHDMTHSEIASATGLPIGTVKSHLRRTLLTLRERLDADLQGRTGDLP
jgi:RNA polymerase sigma-70 factor (ECF subfamily)